MAILTLVPTPSVVATKIGSEKPACLRSKRPPNPPISAPAPGRAVARTSGLIKSTIRLPASMSTPAPAYVSFPPPEVIFCSDSWRPTWESSPAQRLQAVFGRRGEADWGSPSMFEPNGRPLRRAGTRFVYLEQWKKWLCRSQFFGCRAAFASSPHWLLETDTRASTGGYKHSTISFYGVRGMPVMSDRVLMKELSEAKSELKGDVSCENTQLCDGIGSNLQI